MKKKLVALLTMMTVLACLMLTACSLGTAGTYKLKSMMVGDTEVFGTTYEGEEVNADFLVIELKKDKTCTYSTMGVGINGTWEKSGKEVKATLTVLGISIPHTFTVDGKTLTMEDEGIKYVFEKQ